MFSSRHIWDGGSEGKLQTGKRDKHDFYKHEGMGETLETVKE